MLQIACCKFGEKGPLYCILVLFVTPAINIVCLAIRQTHISSQGMDLCLDRSEASSCTLFIHQCVLSRECFLDQNG